MNIKMLVPVFFLCLIGIAPANAADRTDSAESKRETDGTARTLDAIQIEGEVDMPQVLFITARERYRTMDHLHRHYVKSCSRIGREAQIAKRLGRPKDDIDGNLSKEN